MCMTSLLAETAAGRVGCMEETGSAAKAAVADEEAEIARFKTLGQLYTAIEDAAEAAEARKAGRCSTDESSDSSDDSDEIAPRIDAAVLGTGEQRSTAASSMLAGTTQLEPRSAPCLDDGAAEVSRSQTLPDPSLGLGRPPAECDHHEAPHEEHREDPMQRLLGAISPGLKTHSGQYSARLRSVGFDTASELIVHARHEDLLAAGIPVGHARQICDLLPIVAVQGGMAEAATARRMVAMGAQDVVLLDMLMKLRSREHMRRQ